MARYAVRCNCHLYRKSLLSVNFLRPPIRYQWRKLLEQITGRLGLTARSYTRILKIARMVAALAGRDQIENIYLAEAIQFRGLGRKLS